MVTKFWLEVWLPYQKKIILSGVYQEHDHLKKKKNEEEHNGNNEQEERWSRFLNQRKEALTMDKEMLVVGDINLDLLLVTRRAVCIRKFIKYM